MTTAAALLEGALNFRDMGGYETEDGRRVRRGVLFRSAELSRLTDRDLSTLTQLGIRTILDYRDDEEAEQQPNRLLDSIAYERIPAFDFGDYPPDRRVRLTPETLLQFYAWLPFGNRAYRHLFQLLLQPERTGLVQHCAVGKDRTGVGSALVLLALGVPRRTILADYERTNEHLAALKAQLLAAKAAEPGTNESELRTIEKLIAADPAYLEHALNAIANRYSTDYDAYFQHELGLAPQQRMRLQELYLEA